MAELIRGLTAPQVRANLEAVRERVAVAARRSGRSPEAVEIVAATKYVASEDLGALAAAGIAVAGENRAQDLEAKATAHPGAFTWDFIGRLQSRKVRQVAPLVRLVHSVCTDSAVAQLQRHAPPDLRVLVQVNVAGEPGKDGVAPGELDAFLERCTSLDVAGLMTMPPLAAAAEDSRRWFAALRELGAERDLGELSMGTTQDFEVAVQEGATLVRIGTSLYAPASRRTGAEG